MILRTAMSEAFLESWKAIRVVTITSHIKLLLQGHNTNAVRG